MNEEQKHTRIINEAERVDWVNIGRVVSSLREHPWNRYDNNYWRPNFKQAEIDLRWLLDNIAGMCEDVEQLKAEALEKVQAQKEADGFHYRLEAFCTVAGKS